MPDRTPEAGLRDAAQYLATIERFWLLLRRRGLMVSAEDVRQIELWREAGIPERIVCRALLEGAERFRQSRADDEPLPSTLRYFRDTVAELARQWRDQASIAPAGTTSGHLASLEPPSAGSAPGEPEAGARSPETAGGDGSNATAHSASVAALQAPLVAAGRVESDERVRGAYRDAWRALEALRREFEDGRPPADLLDALVAVDATLVDGLRARLSPDARTSIEEEVEAALEAESERLGAHGRAERRRALLESSLARRFALLRLVPAPSEGPTVAGMGWWRTAGHLLDEDDE